jgi:hypothetical protein
MKFMTRWMPALVAGAMMLTGCNTDSTVAPLLPQVESSVFASAAEHTVEERLTDFDGVFFSFACSADGVPIDPEEGELVRMQGQLYQKHTTRRDAQGGFHITLQSMPVGLVGFGVTSGEEFRVIEREHASYNQTKAGYNGAWRAELKMTGQDTKRTFWLVFSGNYRLSAEGDLVVERESQTVVCRPGM